eukprot:605569-Amphidinium_carterae.1
MRCNYLSSDRPEISYASKESARHMSCPNEVGMEQTKRIIRYLHGAPRMVAHHGAAHAHTRPC